MAGGQMDTIGDAYLVAGFVHLHPGEGGAWLGREEEEVRISDVWINGDLSVMTESVMAGSVMTGRGWAGRRRRSVSVMAGSKISDDLPVMARSLTSI